MASTRLAAINQRRAQSLEVDLPDLAAHLHEESIGEQKENMEHSTELFGYRRKPVQNVTVALPPTSGVVGH